MRTLALFAFSTIATAAMAANVTETPNTISITGTSTQIASVNGGSVNNIANAKTYANQNVASNKGGIDISGKSTQAAVLTNASVHNEAKSAGDVAVQNLASNVGQVSVGSSASSTGKGDDKGGGKGPKPGEWIKGESNQTVVIDTGGMYNVANSSNGCYGDNCKDTAIAYQNAASNMGEISITGKSTQSVGISGNAYASNQALGKNTVAVQNLSSNYGEVIISGTSIQSTSVSNGAVLANLATGDYARAYQNFATNDSCDPPPAVCVGPHCGLLASR